jgi:hypothetical protein
VRDTSAVAGGIYQMLQTPYGPLVRCRLADDSTRAKWRCKAEAELWQLVALHSYLDPDLMYSWDEVSSLIADASSLDSKCLGHDPALLIRLHETIGRAVLDLDSTELPSIKYVPGAPETSVVSIAEFHAWTIRAAVRPVLGFPARGDAPTGRFPWGNYSTPRLEQFAAACELWRLVEDGGSYDPSKPWTAPHPKAVAARLAELGVPKSLFEAFGAFTRDPRLPLGPRPSAPEEG